MYGMHFAQKIVLTYCEKNCPGDQGKSFANSRLQTKIFKDRLNNLFEQWKVRPIFETEYARTYLQLPLRQWGTGNVYPLVLSSWKVNIAENPIAVIGL